MKRIVKHCVAQLLVVVFYVTGMAYRTGNNGSGMIENLKLWAEK